MTYLTWLAQSINMQASAVKPLLVFCKTLQVSFYHVFDFDILDILRSAECTYNSGNPTQ